MNEKRRRRRRSNGHARNYLFIQFISIELIIIFVYKYILARVHHVFAFVNFIYSFDFVLTCGYIVFDDMEYGTLSINDKLRFSSLSNSRYILNICIYIIFSIRKQYCASMRIFVFLLFINDSTVATSYERRSFIIIVDVVVIYMIEIPSRTESTI